MKLTEIGSNAKETAAMLNTLGPLQKNQGLQAVAKSLLDGEQEILDANEQDVAKAVADGMSPGLVDRLKLTPARVKAMADGLLQVVALDDPVGEVLSMKNRPNGLVIGQKRVPIGVIGIIYE
ncbi:MAG: gamma-glutamyl-phosphate reductase, partial [Hungatella hathewayi]